jgi:Kae1-associated kinase Bud32
LRGFGVADEQPERPVSRGAEASLHAVEWLGLPALRKERESKSYRPKNLDERLKRERTRNEVRLLTEARRLGVRTPIVYDVDLPQHRLILEQLPGPTLKDLIDSANEDSSVLEAPIRALGVAIGRLHAGGISHGDLTSSNILYPEGPHGAPALLDLSMGARNAGVEERGIDLHLVEEDLKALHPNGEALFRTFLEGYAEGNPSGHADVRKRAREIRGRVRYA